MPESRPGETKIFSVIGGVAGLEKERQDVQVFFTVTTAQMSLMSDYVGSSFQL